MEIRDLKQGDYFIKHDGKTCQVLTLSDCCARIQVWGLTKTVTKTNQVTKVQTSKQVIYSDTHNVSPGTEVLRVLDGKPKEEVSEVKKEDGSIQVRSRKKIVVSNYSEEEITKMKDQMSAIVDGLLKTIEFKGKVDKVVGVTSREEGKTKSEDWAKSWTTVRDNENKLVGVLQFEFKGDRDLYKTAAQKVSAAEKKSEKTAKSAETEKPAKVAKKAAEKAAKKGKSAVKVLSSKEAKKVEARIKKESGDKPARSLTNGQGTDLPFSKKNQLAKRA